MCGARPRARDAAIRLPAGVARATRESQIDPGIGAAVQRGQESDDGKYRTCKQSDEVVYETGGGGGSVV